MQRILMTSRYLRVFACVLLTLTYSIAIDAATRSSSSGNVIRIWIVGSPHTNELPPAVIPADLRQRAESLGHTIEIEAFRAGGFAAHYHQALQNHTEPEILTFDNYGIIIGMKTANGWVEGIDWDRRTASSLALVHETMTSLQSRGWVMLVRSAVNYEAARSLAMRPAECDTRSARTPPPTSTALLEAREQAVLAARAHVECDRSTLGGVSDEARMVQQCFHAQSDTKAEQVKACSVSGNEKLAFVSLVSNFSAEVRDLRALGPSKQGMDLGQKSMLAVLTNQSGTWRLLAITHDPMNTLIQHSMTTNKLASLLDPGLPIGITPEPARLLTPDGYSPVSLTTYGDFNWEPSRSRDVIGQVVEFMWGREFNWGVTRLFFLPPGQSKLSSGLLMNGGPTVWRVWTVNKFGDVVFSEQRSFKNCPCPTNCPGT